MRQQILQLGQRLHDRRFLQQGTLLPTAVAASAVLSLLFLTGCGGGVFTPPYTLAPVFPSVTGNWQIQTALGASSPGPLLQGALLQTGNNVTGAFRFINLDVGSACSTSYQAVTLQGTVDTSGKLTLLSDQLPNSSSAISIQLQLSTLAHNYNGGTIAVLGGSCAYPSTPSLGVQIASISGSYSGQLFTPGTLQGVYGKVVAQLVQDGTTGSEGQYGISGTVAFAGTLCSVTLPVSGVLNGDELLLTSPANSSGVSELVVHAAPDSNALELLNIELAFSSGPCTAAASPYGSYTGTLTRTS